MLAGPAVLAGACVILGVFACQIFVAAGYVIPFPGPAPRERPPPRDGRADVHRSVLHSVTGNTGQRDLGAAGQRSQPAITEYTGHGFSEPVVTIFSSVYRTKKSSTKTYFDKAGCLFAGGTAEIRLVAFFEEYLYRPLGRAAMKGAAVVARMQNGCLDTYLLYVFIAVVGVIIFLGVVA